MFWRGHNNNKKKKLIAVTYIIDLDQKTVVFYLQCILRGLTSLKSLLAVTEIYLRPAKFVFTVLSFDISNFSLDFVQTSFVSLTIWVIILP